MNSELKIWAMSSAASVAEAIAERKFREQVFMQDPGSVKEMIWEWFPGTVKVEGKVARMSCRAPLFLEDYQRIQKNLAEVDSSDKFEMLILDVNSPGGQVCGVKETWEALKSFSKPAWAVCCGMATSAAYWLSSACDVVSATESSTVGSVGVIATHVSLSKMNESQGIVVTEVCRGSKKNQFSSNKELDEGARKELDKQVSSSYKNFVDCVSESRKDIDKRVFDSGVYSGQDALESGLIDQIDNTLGAL